MLKFLRSRGVKHKIFVGLAVAVISSFVISGVIVNQEDSKTTGPLGTIGKYKISVKDYLDSYRAVQHQLQFMFGERWGEMNRFINLKGEAWDRILLHEEAGRRGLRASDKEVVEWIAGQAAFQRKGKYYPELYRMAVRDALRMEPRDFEEEMRKTLTVQKLSSKIVSGITVEDAELRKTFDEERTKKNEAHDDAAFEKEKETLRKDAIARKSQDAMRDLLEKLRVGLQLDIERMKEIFPEEPEAAPKPASAEYPSVPS